MRDLTVPTGMLPAGCALAPVPFRILLGPTNPWIGTDREQIISIREGMTARPRNIPDGPPIDAGAMSRYRAQLANGVEEAYGAVYTESENFVIVRAIRFAPGAPHSAPELSENQKMMRVDIGPIVAIVTGSGDCFQAVGAHLKSLAN
jgi:hypothetical protein